MACRKRKQLLDLSACTPEPVDWLWPARLAAGKLSLIDGGPGEGRSLVTVDVAARFSAGGPLPDGYRPPCPFPVVLAGSEDDVIDTIRPRLCAAGADLKRIVPLIAREGRRGAEAPLILPGDERLLREALRDSGARLMIIDSVATVFAALRSGQQLRQALTDLANLARRYKAAVLLVRHLAKGSGGEGAIYRGAGSMAIVGAARTAFLVASYPEQDQLRVFAPTKNNLGPLAPALAFRIVAAPTGEPRIDWQGEVDLSADDLVTDTTRPRAEAIRCASKFLVSALRQGPQEVVDLLAQARALGISRRALKIAKVQMMVASLREDQGSSPRWVWRLTTGGHSTAGLVGPELIAAEEAEAQRRTDEAVAAILARYEQHKRRMEAAGSTSEPPAEPPVSQQS